MGEMAPAQISNGPAAAKNRPSPPQNPAATASRDRFMRRSVSQWLRAAKLLRGGPNGAHFARGAAGFIALRTAQQLLARGDEVFGLDDLNDFNREIKLHRLAELRGAPGFRFAEVDVAERDGLRAALPEESFDAVINLAAQAGVRASVAIPGAFCAPMWRAI